jgi:tellurite methyltransferase
MTANRNRDWNERHARGEAGATLPEPVLVSAIQNVEPGRALDLACGLGRNTLMLAAAGWDVTAVDYSDIALSGLRERCMELTLRVQIVNADLERGEFDIPSGAYDLICDCLFLHRPLFHYIREGIRPGGLFVGIFPLRDEMAARPMNPAFLVESGELRSYFDGWEILHYVEERPGGDPTRRLMARIVARKS